MNFYEQNFFRALERVSYPQKEIFHHWVVEHEFGIAIWTQFQTSNFDLDHTDAILSATISLRHKFGILYTEIPTNDKQAEDFFIQKIFLMHMQIMTHEAMEAFAVDNKRFRNPHQRGLYMGARDNVDVHTSTTLWRNHVMWEACALVAKSEPPDYRTGWEKTIDSILEWDERKTREIWLKFQTAQGHFLLFKSVVRAKWKEDWRSAIQYSIGMARLISETLLSGWF
jgi:hypothetical protein